jgi:hypothetical protein
MVCPKGGGRLAAPVIAGTITSLWILDKYDKSSITVVKVKQGRDKHPVFRTVS